MKWTGDTNIQSLLMRAFIQFLYNGFVFTQSSVIPRLEKGSIPEKMAWKGVVLQPPRFLLIVFEILMADKWTVSSPKLIPMNNAFFFQNLYLLFNELDVLEILSKSFAVTITLPPKSKVKDITVEDGVCFPKKKKKKHKWFNDSLKATQQFRGNID